jgi:hypothetical protein
VPEQEEKMLPFYPTSNILLEEGNRIPDLFAKRKN